MADIPRATTPPFNSIWLSDIHLGYKGCRAEFLLDFLERARADVIYLVGDVVDFWAMKRHFLWPESHQAVLRKLLALAAAGTRVVYIPGNHDEYSRELCGNTLLNIEILAEAIHTTANGKRLLLLHGDQFDHAVRCGLMHRLAGDLGYDLLLFLNRWGNRLRGWLGLPYWSLAYYIKNRVKNARAAIDAFENAAAQEARRRGLDGIVCGHIHQPEIRAIDGVLYCNDGDWIESCTALVEHRDGRLELLHWGDLQQALKCDRAANDETTPKLLRLPALAGKG
ncbi:MAG: UDP-2,3-diacylglucosamine diphosphatase [Pseudomonadota bacterium]|nr:UDP-2,3-diacylglucosamine diphosphatase [Pseudomonadota bacterium]